MRRAVIRPEHSAPGIRRHGLGWQASVKVRGERSFEPFPVTTPLFSTLLVSVILIVGALTFFPALSLGPILEHLLMNAGRTF